MDLFGINIGSLEGALATAIVMTFGWVLQYRRTKTETDKIKKEIDTLSQQNSALKTQTDNEMIKIWKLQIESDNETIKKLIDSNDTKERMIESLKNELSAARDELRSSSSELKHARIEIHKLRIIIERNIKGLDVDKEIDRIPDSIT